MGGPCAPLTSRNTQRTRSSCPGHAPRPTHTLGTDSFTRSVCTKRGLPRGCWEQGEDGAVGPLLWELPGAPSSTGLLWAGI